MNSSSHLARDLPPTERRPESQARFQSIVFDDPEAEPGEHTEPQFFHDLNLDQIVESMLVGREEYGLEPLFYTPLHDVATVEYRHEVLRDLETQTVAAPIGAFAKQMRSHREQIALARKLRYKHQKESLFLAAVETYVEAVAALAEELARLELTSRGFKAFTEHLLAYTESGAFTTLVAETRERKAALASVNYSIEIKGNRVRATKYEGETDYSVEVGETFAKFRQGAVQNYLVQLHNPIEMDNVEARVLGLVAKLFPDVFAALDDYSTKHSEYLDATIAGFDREVQFYLAYLEYIERFKSAGLAFCYPVVSDQSKEIRATEVFDLALANVLVPKDVPVVSNNLYLVGRERIIVVTGPNQGGKTTFARMFGQLHYLASLGYLVPGRKAQLFLPDRIFTHFEREEDPTTLQGKLEDELVRIHTVLKEATPGSIVIMNESFSSTTLNDALFLSKEVMTRFIALDALCVYVTFLDELASLSETTVSMASTVVPDNPVMRTYKVVRKPADGLAYAVAIAEKYGLTHDLLRERVAG